MCPRDILFPILMRTSERKQMKKCSDNTGYHKKMGCKSKRMHQYAHKIAIFLWRIHIQWVNNVIPYLNIYKKMSLKLAVVISTVSGINRTCHGNTSGARGFIPFFFVVARVVRAFLLFFNYAINYSKNIIKQLIQ
jgi:hypothetical protein